MSGLPLTDVLADDDDDGLQDRTALLTPPPRPRPGRRRPRARPASPPLRCLALIKTLSICLAFFALGLCIALPGPTLLDLRDQVRAPLKLITQIFLWRAIGYLAGSTLSGLLFDRLNRLLMMLLSIVLAAGGMAAVPWMKSVLSLNVCFAAVGVPLGFVDTGGNVLLLDLWGKSSGPYMQAIHFSFGLGAFVAPLLAVPFLANAVVTHPHSNDSSVTALLGRGHLHTVPVPDEMVMRSGEEDKGNVTVVLPSIGGGNVMRRRREVVIEEQRKAEGGLGGLSEGDGVGNVNGSVNHRSNALPLKSPASTNASLDIDSLSDAASPGSTAPLALNHTDISSSNDSNSSNSTLPDSTSNVSAAIASTTAQTPVLDHTPKPKPSFTDGNQLEHDQTWARPPLKPSLSVPSAAAKPARVNPTTSSPSADSDITASESNGRGTGGAATKEDGGSSQTVEGDGTVIAPSTLVSSANDTDSAMIGGDSNTLSHSAAPDITVPDTAMNASLPDSVAKNKSVIPSQDATSVSGNTSASGSGTSRAFEAVTTQPTPHEASQVTKEQSPNSQTHTASSTTVPSVAEPILTTTEHPSGTGDIASTEDTREVDIVSDGSVYTHPPLIDSLDKISMPAHNADVSEGMTTPPTKGGTRMPVAIKATTQGVSESTPESVVVTQPNLSTSVVAPTAPDRATPPGLQPEEAQTTQLRPGKDKAINELPDNTPTPLVQVVSDDGMSSSGEASVVHSPSGTDEHDSPGPAVASPEDVTAASSVPSTTDQLELVEDSSEPPSTSGSTVAPPVAATPSPPHHKPGTYDDTSEEEGFLSRLSKAAAARGVPLLAQLYLLAAACLLLVGLIFLMLLVYDPRAPRAAPDDDGGSAAPRCYTITLVALMSLVLCFYVGMEVAMGQLLMNFSVHASVHLTRAGGAYVTSVFWGLFAGGRALSVCFAGVLRPALVLALDYALVAAGATLLLAAGSWDRTALLAGCGLTGLGMASVFPAALVWLEQHVHVSSRLAAALVISGALGEMVMPAGVGALMAREPRALTYTLAGCVCVCLLAQSVAALVARPVRPRGAPVGPMEGYQLAAQDDDDELILATNT